MPDFSSLKAAMRGTHFDKITFESGYYEIWDKGKTRKIGLVRMNVNFPPVTNPNLFEFFEAIYSILFECCRSF